METRKITLACAAVVLVVLFCLTVASTFGSRLQSDAGDLNIAPQGNLILNVSEIQMRSPDGSWSCCHPNPDQTWACTEGECT